MEHVNKTTGPELPISEAKLLPQDPVKDHVRGGVKTQLPSAALPLCLPSITECKAVSYPVIPRKQGDCALLETAAT